MMEMVLGQNIKCFVPDCNNVFDLPVQRGRVRKFCDTHSAHSKRVKKLGKYWHGQTGNKPNTGNEEQHTSGISE